MMTFPMRSLFLSLTIFSVALLPACDQGSEGDRCNPDLSHDECNAGLTCSGPGTSQGLACVENYCCPTPASESSNPYCNGEGCPAPADDSGGDSADDAGPDGS